MSHKFLLQFPTCYYSSTILLHTQYFFQTMPTLSKPRRRRTHLPSIFLLFAIFLSSSTDAFITSRNSMCSNDMGQQYLFGLNNNGETTSAKDIPFIVERINRKPSDNVFRDIAEMCINVFFKEQLNAKPGDRVAPWKETQINYLKSLQTADLQRRRYLYPNENEMFLAYEVVPVAQDFCQEPLILDFSKVYNLAKRNNRQEYVRGDLLGFCEITQRPYGIGSSSGIVYDDDPELEVRPILTNLAVKRDMRKYGIGSKLLDECERHVQKDWKLGDIVLEVEDYNTRALDFYSNRGYELIFDDPASRRYDVSGFVLRKVRCTRKVFRKVFDESSSGDKNKEGTVTIDLNFFKRIRETVGV